MRRSYSLIGCRFRSARWTGLLSVFILLAVSAARADELHKLDVVARDPGGHGLLCESQGKTILIVSGTPQQMGTAHGTLLKQQVRNLVDRVVYMVGGIESIQSGKWFLDTMEEIQRRTLPHVPGRFFVECDALSDAAGIDRRDGRYANLFPERFHCSGVAVRGKASLDGQVIHARVLDYMRDINLQSYAAVVVFIPEGHHAWMSLGYAGFVGSVTAMNERGLAIGEMGGGGEGDWDGMPMSFLVRDVMERASTVEEGLEILKNTPRTCQYYYVLSDKSGNIAGVKCDAREITVLRPGRQHPELPLISEDTVLISAGDRAKTLSQRLQDNHGKIDVPAMIEMIKRPVAMNSNLHDAIFTPQTLDMWFADAGKWTPACDEPYAHCNLAELIRFYKANVRKELAAGD
jgi:isopenicillin-N N-acyltransferase like protein